MAMSRGVGVWWDRLLMWAFALADNRTADQRRALTAWLLSCPESSGNDRFREGSDASIFGHHCRWISVGRWSHLVTYRLVDSGNQASN
ncbi:hypothetical protein J3F84DRAFT_366621 [Trichoderma pleuroticola]